MTDSIFVVLLILVAVAALFIVLLPQLWRRSVDGEGSAEWLKIRREELAGEANELLEEAALRAVDDLKSESESTRERYSNSPRWVVLLLPLVALLISAAVYIQIGATPDVRILEKLETVNWENPDSVREVIGDIESRVLSRPENIDYLAMLGEFYVTSADHQKALETYEQLLTLLPENAEVLGRAAQAEFMSNDRQLSVKGRERAQAALAINPAQRAALGTLGMWSFEQEQYPEAIAYWEKLMATESPGSPGREVMAQVIAEAKRRGGIEETAELPAVGAAGVKVAVSPPEGVTIDPTHTVFILARPAGSAGRMPLAVARSSAATWPIEVFLSDANSMAGQKISTFDKVDIEVQVSRTGQPGRNNADWFATAEDVVISASSEITLVLTANSAD